MLLSNGKFKKFIHKCKTKKYSEKKYSELLDENKNILFPKKFIITKTIKDVNFEICLVRDWLENDSTTLVKDFLGRWVNREVFLDKYCLLKRKDFLIEETFYVFGFDPVSERKTIKTIIKLLVKGINDESLTKNVIVLHNKLIIFNEHQFDIVICKCEEDCLRLYDTLRNIAKKRVFRRLLFMGIASEMMVGRLYEMMMDVTDWDYRKVSRLSTN
jgi:hypothetical protein